MNKRCLAILMSIVLIVGLMPLPAVAAVQATSLDTQATDVAYDVSNGQYKPYDTVRRLYTRPITLTPSEGNKGEGYRTSAIDLQNPIYDGADIAVRYTGAKPYLAFCDKKWKGWTTKLETRIVEDEATGQKVALFSRTEIQRKWDEQGGGNPDRIVDGKKTGVSYECQWMFVCVDSNAAGTCNLIEVVALDGDHERISLTQEQKVRVTGKTASEIAQDMKAGYNMAGHFESHYVPKDAQGNPTATRDGGWGKNDLMLEAHWARGTYVTRETIRNLKKEGFNAIRLPVTWYQHIYPVDDPTGDCATRTDLDPLDRYHIDRAWMERVHEVVDWCIAEDMYVIVNIHHEDWIDRSDLGTAYDETDLPVKFEAVWTQIANEFSGYDQRLVFEDMNEPHAKNGDDWGYATADTVNTVNRLNADFVDLMRNKLSGHQNRLLMMAHDTGNGSISATNFVMPEDAKNLLAHSLHCYSPHDWTHYFADGNHANESGEGNVYTEMYRKEVESKWEGYRTRYIANGETIILGEFGCFYYGSSEDRQQDRLDWMTQYATHAKELGIPMFYWRMDRTAKDANGDEYVIWSAFDEVKQQISSQSSAMFAKWFEILNDDSVAWGSLATMLEGEHADLDEGIQLLCSSGAWPQEIRGNHGTGVDAWRVICSHRADAGSSGGKTRLKWSDIAGKEVAVKFTGSVPRLGCMNDAWGGDSWGVEPDSVDYGNGIAYFSSERIALRWNSVVASSSDSRLAGNTEEDISRIVICTATSGGGTATDDAMTTTIQQVAIVPVTSKQLVAPTCTQPGKKTVGNSGATTLIPALGHAWATSYAVDEDPTLKAEGSKSIHCERCGVKKNVTAIPKLINISKATVTLSATELAYSGKAQKNPTVKKVVLGKKTLSPKTDYTVTNVTKSPKAIGAYKITVEGKNLYGGKMTATFKIVPKPTVLSKVAAGKASFTASWKKQATQTTGYQLQYALNSKFKSAKTLTVKGAKILSKKVGKLKAGKKYWVRVRTYKTIGSKTYYSAWSKAKTVTTK